MASCWGGFLGYAAWLSRSEIRKLQVSGEDPIWPARGSSVPELLWILAAGLITYAILPASLEPFVEAAGPDDGPVLVVLRSIARIMVNYAFYGFIFVVFMIRLPRLAFQLGITLTFTHSAVDLVRDNLPELHLLLQAGLVVLMASIVAGLTAFYTRRRKILQHLFLVLIWSCLAISFLKLPLNPERVNFESLSFCQVLCGRMIVDLFFLISSSFYAKREGQVLKKSIQLFRN